MPDLIYRFDPDDSAVPPAPGDAREAVARLLEGNARFVGVLKESTVIHIGPARLGKAGEAPPQRPFASVLACSDARVPVELAFGCGANELFVVRVAGNVPGDECLGSLEYAAATMGDSVQVVVVLGHTGCGAVTSAVSAYMDPRTYPESGPLRSVVDRILPSVRAADNALKAAHGGAGPETAGGRTALIDLAVTLNTTLAAMTVRNDLGGDVVCGIFDLASRKATLEAPPADADAYVTLAAERAVSDHIRGMLTA